MSKRHTVLMAAACLGLASSIAQAQEANSTQALTLEQARLMDADRNGRITEEEFLRQSSDRRLFARLDANLDGALDNEEQLLGIRVPVRTSR